MALATRIVQIGRSEAGPARESCRALTIRSDIKEIVQAWNLLLTSDIGLLSVFTIVFVIVMALYILRYAIRKMGSETREHELPPGVSRAGR